MNEKKLKAIAQEAELALWAVVTKHYPNAESGDFAPDISFRLSSIIERSIEVWVESNVPEESKKDHDHLIEELFKRPINGWQFEYDSHTLSWSYAKNDHVVYCTPDWEDVEGICIQHCGADGELVGDGGDEPIPYKGELTVDQFVELMTPVLARIEAEFTKEVRS